MKRLTILLLLTVLLFGKTTAQIDTEFWFAAPDLEENHAQMPIRFSISSFEQPATVIFEQPANPSYAPQTFHLNANDFHVYDVSDIINMVETQPFNTVLNYGFHIYSTTPVSVYYESDNINSEIYSLKGKNALGKRFVVPMQNTHNNCYSTTCSRIEVVAAEDGTIVTFVPSRPIKGGGQPGVPINVTLNCGQTYAIEAALPDGPSHLGNTWVTSNKPIAVNSSDDSAYTGDFDLVGDQIVPVNLLGMEYLALWNGTSNEYLFFFPTEDNTKIYLNGGSTPIVTLNVGQEYAHHLNSSVVYVQSDKPMAVFNLTCGENNELGGTILPHIKCTGSRKAVYKRNNNADIVVTLVVKTECVDGFRFNGNASVLTSSDFNVVVSNPTYSYCKKNVSDFIQYDGLMTLENIKDDGYFQLGVFSSSGGTCSYGFFSDYHEYTYANFEMDNVYCVGDNIIFEFDSEGVDDISILQPDGHMLTQQPFVLENVQIEQSGQYVLQGIACDGIQSLDYIDIVIGSAGVVFLDTISCGPFPWGNGVLIESGVYDSLFHTSTGCDSIIHLNLTIAEGYQTELDVNSCHGSYLWNGIEYHSSGIYQEQFQAINSCDSIVTLHLTLGYAADICIQGKTAIMPATDLISGNYSYYIDSTNIDPVKIKWSIDRDDWILTPHGASCDLLCTSPGCGILHVWTDNEICNVDTTLILNATFYGTEENDIQFVSIYPNPTNGNVTVACQNIVGIKVYNLFGQLMKEYKFEGQDKCSLDIGGYIDAVYFLEIFTSNRRVYMPVVLKQ